MYVKQISLKEISRSKWKYFSSIHIKDITENGKILNELNEKFSGPAKKLHIFHWYDGCKKYTECKWGYFEDY